MPNHRLVVVVVARNEASRIGACLESLAAQSARPKVLVSDNASDDATAAIAATFSDRVDLTLRTTALLGPSEHFVSAGRWALEAHPSADYFALLAGDDEWTETFAEEAISALTADRSADAAFPSFSWTLGEEEHRSLSPFAFLEESGSRRRLRALLSPDRRELANLVYGIYRPHAFAALLDAWEAGGDEFASDFAAVWSLLGAHRVAAAPAAVAQRHVRAGQDLVERAWGPRDHTSGLLSQAAFYVRLNLRINGLIAAALQRVDPAAPKPWQVQLARAPQWLVGALQHVRARRIGT